MYTEETTFEKEHHNGGEMGTSEHKDFMKTGSEALSKVEKVAAEAYDKTAQVVSESYEHAATYAKEYPERTTLIAFGLGLGLGILLGSRRSHSTRYYAAPVVDALYDVAQAFIRR